MTPVLKREGPQPERWATCSTFFALLEALDHRDGCQEAGLTLPEGAGTPRSLACRVALTGKPSACRASATDLASFLLEAATTDLGETV